MKSWGNGFEELMVNGWLAMLIINGMIILSDWYYVIPNQIETWNVIIPLSSIIIITLIGIMIYYYKLDTELFSEKNTKVMDK